MSIRTMLRHMGRRFRRDEEGGATIEAVLWLPMFIVFFVMVADVSFIFHRQSQILRVTQDANRAFSVGRFDSESETETFIESTLRELSQSTNAATTVADGVISTSVRIPVEDLVAVGFFSFLADYDIEVIAEHFLEY